MEITERTQTETKRIIEVNGYEFYVEDLVGPLGWLRHGSVEDELVDTGVLRRMKEAGLVKYDGGARMMSEDTGIKKWKDNDGKCKELFNELNEPYYRLRVRTDHGGNSHFGMYDEQEDDEAREKAQERLEELDEHNPDVDFKIDEEELSSFRIRE